MLVALVHETLKMERFDNLADLTAAVKARAARLRIPYDGPRLTEALHVVGRTRALVLDTWPRVTPPPVEVPMPPPVPADVASRIVRELWRRREALR